MPKDIPGQMLFDFNEVCGPIYPIPDELDPAWYVGSSAKGNYGLLDVYYKSSGSPMIGDIMYIIWSANGEDPWTLATAQGNFQDILSGSRRDIRDIAISLVMSKGLTPKQPRRNPPFYGEEKEEEA